MSMLTDAEKGRVINCVTKSKAIAAILTEGNKYCVPLFLCGGALRDSLFGKVAATDLDIYLETDEATFSRILLALSQNPIWSKESSVIENIDLARCDSITDQIKSFDFTVNTLAFNVGTQELIDPTGAGLRDIREGVLVPASTVLFLTSPRAHLRLFRLQLQKFFSIPPATLTLVKRYSSFVLLADPLDKCALLGEMLDLLSTEKIADTLTQISECGILERVMPHLTALLEANRSKLTTLFATIEDFHLPHKAGLPQGFLQRKMHICPFDKKYNRKKIAFFYSELSLLRLTALLHLGFDALINLENKTAPSALSEQLQHSARQAYFDNFIGAYAADADLAQGVRACQAASLLAAAQKTLTQVDSLENVKPHERWALLVSELAKRHAGNSDKSLLMP